MKSKLMKRGFGYLIAIGISILLLFFFIGSTWIGYEVKNSCGEAEEDYEGDCVGALSELVKDETKGFRERNRAIWALGQLGDQRALTVLESHYTGEILEREPVDEMISQYELKKAIKLTKGGVNISAFIWSSFYNER